MFSMSYFLPLQSKTTKVFWGSHPEAYGLLVTIPELDRATNIMLFF